MRARTDEDIRTRELILEIGSEYSALIGNGLEGLTPGEHLQKVPTV